MPHTNALLDLAVRVAPNGANLDQYIERVNLTMDDEIAVEIACGCGIDLQQARVYVAAPDLLAALEKIRANAAESPEWIRMVIDPVIARATGTPCAHFHEVDAEPTPRPHAGHTIDALVYRHRVYPGK